MVVTVPNMCANLNLINLETLYKKLDYLGDPGQEF